MQWHSAGMAEVPADHRWMEPALVSRLASMRYTKRRDEARLGRWTAKTTVARALDMPLDVDALRRIRIVNAYDGAPEVTIDGSERDLVIAMTDRADWAVCTVLAGTARVGCDLELVEPRSRAFVGDYFTPAEQAWCAASEGDWDLATNLVWSAKESALKVLRTGLRRDTRTVEVDIAAWDVEANGTWQSLEVHDLDAPGRTFPGWWIRYGEFVLTAVAAVDTDAPRHLVDPAPLSLATPGHLWMERPLTD